MVAGPGGSSCEDLDAWDPTWVAPGCGPVEYLDRMGFIDDRLLVVHGVQFTERGADNGSWRKAPRWSHAPAATSEPGPAEPPVAEFYERGVPVAVGTDSLASVPDLNTFSELAELRRLAPDVPARALLESATINGARALGFDAEFGSMEAGKRDRLIAIDLPSGVTDVEEYLVSGVHPASIKWLSASEG